MSGAVFNSQRPVLHPLPIMGMFYRWHADGCGPFPESRRGNRYIQVFVESYCKQAELVPTPTKEARDTSYAFLHHVLGKYAACAEVVTDQGTEYQGEFAELLADCFIEHRHTSAYHPQGNGLAERMVQTIKRALTKMIENGADPLDWDVHVAYIALAYRVTPQAATTLSPYHMLYAQVPTLPSAIQGRIYEPIDFDIDVESDAAVRRVARELEARAKVIQHQMVIAGQGLRVAQARDTLRYARVHSGSYLPKLRRFQVGDYVYTRDSHDNGAHLHPGQFRTQARTEILRVKEVRSSGVLVLQGRDGNTIEENVLMCAPCHLPIQDVSIQWGYYRVPLSTPCVVCHSPEAGDKMLICDGCRTGWHKHCLNPPMKRVPKAEWFCPECVRDGRDVRVSVARTPAPNLVVRMRETRGTRRPIKARIRPVVDHPDGACLAIYPDGQMEELTRNQVFFSTVEQDMADEVEPIDKELYSLCGVDWSQQFPELLVDGDWNPTCPQNIRRSLLMFRRDDPSWSELSRLNEVCGGRIAGLQLQHPLVSCDMAVLRSSMDFSVSAGMVDLFATQESGFDEFFGDICPVYTNKLYGDFNLDQFLPSSYVRMLKESKADVFVMRPCVEWIPILLPMVATFAPKAVVCQVPHRLDPETSKWLMNKCQDGRVRFLTSSPEPETQAKTQWVIVFQNKFLKRQFCGYNLDDRVDHDYQLALFELMYAHNF